MVVPTKVRAGRVTALLAGRQAAKGTALSDFSGASATRLWTVDAPIMADREKSDPVGWMTSPLMEASGRYNLPAAGAGDVLAYATPASLEWFLRSSWGSFSGGSFSLATQVNEWLSLGWVENALSGATEYFFRIWDAWIHRVTLAAALMGPVLLVGSYAAERDDNPVALNALGGVTLPASPMTPADKNIFPGRLVRLIRDPAGANQEIDLHGITLTLDQGLVRQWDQLQQVDGVFKAGHPGPRVTLDFDAHVSDETWTILSNARAGTRQRYRILATAQAPAKTLQIDLYEVDFEFEEIGHRARQYRPIRASGQAHVDSSGNFVTISLT